MEVPTGDGCTSTFGLFEGWFAGADKAGSVGPSFESATGDTSAKSLDVTVSWLLDDSAGVADGTVEVLGASPVVVPASGGAVAGAGALLDSTGASWVVSVDTDPGGELEAGSADVPLITAGPTLPLDEASTVGVLVTAAEG